MKSEIRRSVYLVFLIFVKRNMIHPIDHHHQEVTTYLLMHIPSWNKSMLRGKLGVYHPYCSTKFSTGECRSNYVLSKNVVVVVYALTYKNIKQGSLVGIFFLCRHLRNFFFSFHKKCSTFLTKGLCCVLSGF